MGIYTGANTGRVYGPDAGDLQMCRVRAGIGIRVLQE